MRPTSGQYILLALGFFAALSLYIFAFPRLYMHQTFPLWRAKAELLREPSATLILGDSRAMAGILPGNGSVNLAIEGGSTIEALALFRKYLASQPAPREVIYSVSPIRFMHDEYFWENTAKARALSLAELLDLFRRADALGDYEFTAVSSRSCPVCTRLRLLGIALGFPYFFQKNIAYGSLFLRGGENDRIERALVEARGAITMPELPEKVNVPGREAYQTRFSPSPILAHCFDELLREAHERGVKVTFAYMPVNPASAASIAPAFNEAFRSFLADRERVFPNFRVIGGFHTVPSSSFADQDHLNAEGAKRYTAWLEQEAAKNAR